MRKVTALLLGMLLPLLGWSGVGQAQSSVQVQGTIQAVDCQAQTVVLSGPGTSNTVSAAPYTAVLVNSTSVPFCALQQYIGAPATAWLLASGNEFTVTRIDVIGPAAAAYPAPPAAVVAPLPIVGIILGTIVVAGLVYLLVRDHDGRYYRYPYYGPYYRYYYRPEYRPYLGPYPSLVLIVAAPPAIVGIVLGTAVVGGLEYLVVRDRDGRFSRYPYYGPYRQYYYRPGYRPYYGPYREAPVHEGGPRWGAPTDRDVHSQGGPGYGDSRGPVPVQQRVLRQSVPAPQTAPAYNRPDWGLPRPQTDRRDGPGYHPGGPLPAQQNVPRWNGPADRNVRNQGGPGYRDPHGPAQVEQGVLRRSAPAPESGPAYNGPGWNRPAPQTGGRRHGSGDREPDQRCSDPRSNQQCADGGRFGR